MPYLWTLCRHLILAIMLFSIEALQYNAKGENFTHKESLYINYPFNVIDNSNTSPGMLNITYPTLDSIILAEPSYKSCVKNNESNLPVKCDFFTNLGTKHRSRHKKQAVTRTRAHHKAKGFCRKPWQFLCENGRCISQDYYCDGKNSCGDNSDELNCTKCNKTIQVTKLWQTLKSPENKEFEKGNSIYCYYLLQIPAAIHKVKNSTTNPTTISAKRHRHKEHHTDNNPLIEETYNPKPLKTAKTETRNYVISLSLNAFNFGLFDESENCFDGYLRIIDGPSFAQSTLRTKVSSCENLANISYSTKDVPTETPNLTTLSPDLRNNCNSGIDPILSHEINGIGSYLCGQIILDKQNPVAKPNNAHIFYSQYNWIRIHMKIRDFDPQKPYFALKFRAIDMSSKSGYRIPKDRTSNHSKTYQNATTIDTYNEILNAEIMQGTLIQMSGNDRSVFITKDTYCNRTYVNCNWPNCKIQSPGYPGFFLPSITCGYRLLNTKPGNIQVKVTQYGDTFNVGSRMCDDPLLCNTILGIRTTKKGCPLAWLSFYDDDRPSNEKLIGTFCGDGKVPTIKSSGKALYIEFKNIADSSALTMRRFYFISTWSEMHTEVPSFGSSFKPGTTNCDINVTSYTLKDIGDTTHVKRKRDQINDDHIWDDNESLTSNQSQLLSRGKIVNLGHWFPANTTCRITLRGRPWERVWLYFKRFSYIPNEDPTLFIPSNATEYTPDPCSDMVSLIDSELENESTKLVARFCGHWGPKICRPAVGGREKGRGRRLKRFLSCPSDSAIYISTGSSFLVVFYGSRGSYSQPDIRYDLRYEFVDTWKHGMSVRGTLCDEEFSPDKRKKGLITSPRNLAFLYYKGRMASAPNRVTPGSLKNQTSSSIAVKRDSKAVDTKDGRLFAINCKYTLKASKYGNEKLLIDLYSLRIHTSSHENRRCEGCCSNQDGTCQNGFIRRNDEKYKNYLNNINYLSIKEIPDSNIKDSSSEVIMSEYDISPCFCNSRYSSIFGKYRDLDQSNFTYITKSSSTVVIEFNVAHLRWKRGNIYPEKQAFELTYEYIKFDCGDKLILNNYEGNIIFPPHPITDKSLNHRPIRGVHCRWKVTVEELFWIFFAIKNMTLGKTCGSSYLKFWVPYSNITPMKDGEEGRQNIRLLKKLCQNESDSEAAQGNNMFYLFSQGFNTHTYYKNHSKLAIVDLLSTHPQTHIHLTFSQISLIKAILPNQKKIAGWSKSWQTSPACKYQCPDNVTCITEQQICTGVPSCPSPLWIKRAQGPGGATGFYSQHVPLTYENPKFCALRNRLRNNWQKILPITAAVLIVIIGVIIVVILVVKKKRVKEQKN